MFDKNHGLRPCAVAFAVALALGLSGCGGGSGGNVRPTPPPPPSTGTGGFTGGEIDVGAGDTTVWTNNVTGSIDLIKGGAGTLVLAGTDTYTNGTTINQGTLQIGNGGTTGSIVGDVKDDAFLVFDRSNDITFSGVVSGTGSVTQAGAGRLILTGNNTYTGGTTISAGGLQLGEDGTTGWLVGNVTDNGSLIFNRSDNVTFSGVVSGSGSLEQAGQGTLVLTRDNTYTGVTTVSQGSLQIGNGGTTGSVAGNIVDNTYYGSLIFDRSDDVTYSGNISGTGRLDKLGTNTLTLSGTNTMEAGVQVEEGTLRIAGGASVSAGAVVGGIGQPAILEIDHGATIPYATLEDGATLDNAGSMVSTFAPIVSGNAVTVLNHDGGIIESDPPDGSPDTPAVRLGEGSTLTNETGGVIRGYSGVSSFGVVNNDGGIITGSKEDGVDGSPTVVNNTNGGQIISGTYVPSISFGGSGVYAGTASAVVNNLGGSSITGDLFGAVLFEGGTVTNDGASRIAGNVGVSIATLSSATAYVTNTGGSTITGTQAGIRLSYGGTIVNGAGSTIEATAPASGDCSVTLACSIYVQDWGGNFGSNGSLTLTNAGNIVGDVQLDPDVANQVTLSAGGSIHGALKMGTNTQSTLTLDGDVATPQLYSTAVTGATVFNGVLVKDGIGTWVIDNNALQGVASTSVIGGFLRATQSLASDVNVGIAGGLDGVPGVAGNLTNAGKVAVHGGDSNIGGNYTQSSTGTLAVSLGSKLAVTGTATLNGGTLQITGADAGYVSNTHTNVLTAGSGLTGTFAQLVKGPGVVFTATTINYDANSVWLDTTGLNVTTAAAGNGVHYTPVSMGSAQRVQGAFDQLDSKIAAGHLSDVSSAFVHAAGQFQQAPTLQAAQASLQSLSGQLHAASAAMTFESIEASSRALSDHFDSLLDKGIGYGLWTHNLSVGGDMARSGFNSVGFQLNGWLVGNDRQIGRNGVAGYAFGQSRGQQQLDQSYDHDNSRTTEGMFYAGWLNGNWYTQGRVGFGHIQQDVNRQILLGQSAQGVGTQYNGNYSVAYDEAGLHFGNGNSHITPFVDVQYARINRDGFAEQGAGGFGLQSDSQTMDRWQAGVGLRANRHWDFGGGRGVDFSARAQWQRSLAEHGEVFDASFVGLQQWQPLVGIGLSRYSGLFGMDMNTTLSRHTSLKFSYDYEAGQHDKAQTLMTQLNVAF